MGVSVLRISACDDFRINGRHSQISFSQRRSPNPSGEVLLTAVETPTDHGPLRARCRRLIQYLDVLLTQRTNRLRIASGHWHQARSKRCKSTKVGPGSWRMSLTERSRATRTAPRRRVRSPLHVRCRPGATSPPRALVGHQGNLAGTIVQDNQDQIAWVGMGDGHQDTWIHQNATIPSKQIKV